MSSDFPFSASSALEDVASILRYINVSILFYSCREIYTRCSRRKNTSTHLAHSSFSAEYLPPKSIQLLKIVTKNMKIFHVEPT